MDCVCSPPPPPPKQNYLIIPCFVEEEQCCYEIYIIPVADLGRKSYTTAQLEPKLVISCREFGWDLCVVGTALFMFNNLISDRNKAFDLCHILDNERVVFLKEEMIGYISPMIYPKRNVKVVPTPAGKILAFSMEIELSFSVSGDSNMNSEGGFQLYYPELDSWEEIPPINHNWDMYRTSRYPHSMSISCYAFIDESTFLIQTRVGYIFHLILGGPGGGFSRWVEGGALGGPLPFGVSSRGHMVGGLLCLTPSIVWDVKNVSKHHVEVCHFPSAFDHNDAYPIDTWSQTILYDNRSACCFLLQTAQHDESGDHFLAIDVYYLDVVKYFKQKVGKETKYLQKKKMLDEENRAANGSSLWEFINNRICNNNPKPSLPSCAPQLGCSLLSSTMLCLSPGSSSPRTLTDSFIAHDVA